MPRPKNVRMVGFQPEIVYFKPSGVPMSRLGEVILGIDELEAVRLKNLLGYSQEEAAQLMKVSQPTLHRLLSGAHRKIAEALINGKAIRVEGGCFKYVNRGNMPPGRRRRGGR